MRFYDRLMEATATDFYQIRRASVIEASNVADYVFNHFFEYTGALFAEIFPCLAPPFDNFFIEYRMPVDKVVEAVPENQRPKFPDNMEVTIGVHGLVAPVTISENAPGEYAKAIRECKWNIFFHLYEEISEPGQERAIKMFDYAPMLHIMEDGTTLQDEQRHTKATVLDAITTATILQDESDPDKLQVLRCYMIPALLAISFMHCKNIKIAEFHQALSRQQRRHCERRGINPQVPCKYRVINISPMREVLRKEGNIEESGLARALHICRGHFANYDENGKLFGKYTGRFWIPMHVKGAAEMGKINQSYKINTEAK